MSMSPGGDRHAAKIFGFDTEEEAQQKAWEKMNPGLSAARQTLLSRATNLSSRPYKGYGGERVAGLSGNEMQASNLARTSTDQGREYANLAGEQVRGVADNEFSGENISKYMNPYTEGVVNQSIKKANLAAADTANKLKGQAASRGAFGGSRQTLMETQNEKNRLETIGDITTSGYAQAYDRAIQGWQADNNRKLGAAQAYQSVGSDITRMNSQQIQDLMATGGASRVLEQMQMDVDYGAFIEERDWDVNNLDTLMKAVSSTGSNSVGGGGNLTGNRASTTGQVIGAISAIAGFFGKNSSTADNSTNVGTWGQNTGGTTNDVGGNLTQTYAWK